MPRTSNLTHIMHKEFLFLWVHSELDHPHGELDTFKSLPPSSAATLLVNSSVTQWMFHQEVMISCLCCGPGRWICLFLHPSLCYTHTVALASRMSSRECRGVMFIDPLILTAFLDYNYIRKTNSSGLLFFFFFFLIPFEETCAVSLLNKLKNCAANLTAVETT